MSDFQNYREESRKNWGTDKEKNLTIEQINCGSMLRMADAAEKMASSYTEMQRQRDMYKSLLRERQAECRRLSKTIAGLRGYITKLKRKQ